MQAKHQICGIENIIICSTVTHHTNSLLRHNKVAVLLENEGTAQYTTTETKYL